MREYQQNSSAKLVQMLQRALSAHKEMQEAAAEAFQKREDLLAKQHDESQAKLREAQEACHELEEAAEESSELLYVASCELADYRLELHALLEDGTSAKQQLEAMTWRCKALVSELAIKEAGFAAALREMQMREGLLRTTVVEEEERVEVLSNKTEGQYNYLSKLLDERDGLKESEQKLKSEMLELKTEHAEFGAKLRESEAQVSELNQELEMSREELQDTKTSYHEMLQAEAAKIVEIQDAHRAELNTKELKIEEQASRAPSQTRPRCAAHATLPDPVDQASSCLHPLCPPTFTLAPCPSEP